MAYAFFCLVADLNEFSIHSDSFQLGKCSGFIFMNML